MSGNELYEECSATGVDKSAKHVACMAYVTGVLDTLGLAQTAGRDGANVCLPGGVTRRQMGDVVKLYLERNPQERHRDAASLAAQALAQAFPCP